MHLKSTQELHDRANELEVAEHYYKLLISDFNRFYDTLADSEFGTRINRDVLVRLEEILEQQIRPEKQALWEEYVGRFGFAWTDRVRIENDGEPAIELVPSSMNFSPYVYQPYGLLHGWALKANGQSGKKVVLTKLWPETTRVTVL